MTQYQPQIQSQRHAQRLRTWYRSYSCKACYGPIYVKKLMMLGLWVLIQERPTHTRTETAEAIWVTIIVFPATAKPMHSQRWSRTNPTIKARSSQNGNGYAYVEPLSMDHNSTSYPKLDCTKCSIPALVWIVIPPAKSLTPSLPSQPPPQIQWKPTDRYIRSPCSNKKNKCTKFHLVQQLRGQ